MQKTREGLGFWDGIYTRDGSAVPARTGRVRGRQILELEEKRGLLASVERDAARVVFHLNCSGRAYFELIL